MRTSDAAPDALETLDDYTLVDLGAQLELDLANIGLALRAHEGLGHGRTRLIKPAIKLSLNTAGALAGVALAPLTLGWSLAVTVVTASITIWDAVDFSHDATKLIA